MPRSVSLAICACALAAGTAGAQTPPLTDVPLEQLLRFEVQNVFGASERLQPVTEAPASVTIVTAEDIERFGYRSLADVLRSVRGFYVTDDRNYSYVGVRGFARAGDYNTRILLLLNGHRINDDVYDQAPIGQELGIDLQMLERVEIIRGPASSLYGTSAFFAVVNLVTKSGGGCADTRIEGAAGSLGTAVVRGWTGGELPNGATYGFGAAGMRTDGVQRLYFPVFDAPETNGGIAAGLDGETLGSALGTFSYKDLDVTALYGRRLKNIPTASYGTMFNPHDPAEWTRDARVLVGATFRRAYRRTRLEVRSTFNRYAYDGEYPYPGEGAAAPLVDFDQALGVRWSVDARVTHPLPGAQTLTLGAEFMNNLRQNQTSVYNDPASESVNELHRSRQGAGYIQDEVKLRPWLIANVGARLDRYEAFTRTTPRAALIVMPSANQSFKYVYGRAFRAPNAYELFYYPHQPRDLAPESIGTHEIDWEQYVGSFLRASISAYAYRAANLITFAVDPAADDPTAYVFVNRAISEAKGIEFEGEIRTRTGMQLVASYTLQRAVDGDDLRLTNSPRQLAKVRIGAPIAAASSAAFELQYVGRRGTVYGSSVAGAAVATVNVRHRLSPKLELFGVVANAFDARYFDPASDEHSFDAIEQNGRTARIGARWTPWAR
jgi:iron complex outermembrane receptor protein